MRLKAQFSVTAGIIPGQPEEQYTRVWNYTDRDFEADQALPPMPEGHVIDMLGDPDQPHNSRFTKMLMEMQQYAASLTNPAAVNWVKAVWTWM